MKSTDSKIALVTGASRGIGARVATLLAQRGADVAINYHSKASRAEDTANAVRSTGRRALLLQADLTKEDQVSSMMDRVTLEYGRLDILVLNASGGLEKDRPPDYAVQINHVAQVRLVNAALPSMPLGGRVVFVTSHMAHFYDEGSMVGPYAPVAASKFAGEAALRAKNDEFAKLGIELVVVSGDMIDGTITPKLLERMHKGTIEARRVEVGDLPTIEDFATAITDAAWEPVGEKTIFVGGSAARSAALG